MSQQNVIGYDSVNSLSNTSTRSFNPNQSSKPGKLDNKNSATVCFLDFGSSATAS